MRFWLPALIVVTVVSAGAHHPFTPYYDASTVRSMTGVVAELRNINPHVVLIVEGRGPDGTTGRWAFEGLPPHVLTRQGTKDWKAKLQVGTRITISGFPAKDPATRVFSGRQVTFQDGSSMIFGPTPEEGDRWICPAPCAYKYPDVRPQ